MERFGSDKPDMRFGMEITDITATVKDMTFQVFSQARAVKGIKLEGYADKLSRKDIDRLSDYAKGIGSKGLAWIKLGSAGLSSSLGKVLSEDELNSIIAAFGAVQGDVMLIMADGNEARLLRMLGMLRIEAANKLGVERKGYKFLWVVEFPFFEYDEESGEYVAMHHPFTSPLDECIPYLETDKASVRAKAYDLVLNGVELSSGSIRITDPELQQTIFSLLGLSEEEAYKKFGYLLDAFKFGPPPHGGMALGLDRLVMQMLGCESLRDVVAFPKLQNASEAMTDCPSSVPQNVLDDLGISIVKKSDN